MITDGTNGLLYDVDSSKALKMCLIKMFSDVDLACQLGNAAKVSYEEITIEHIIEVVCAEMNIDRERMSSSERTREVAIARQLAMFLAKKHTKQPLTNIGAAIGGRNHATVLHSCKTISNLMDTEKLFRQQVEQIEKSLLIIVKIF